MSLPLLWGSLKPVNEKASLLSSSQDIFEANLHSRNSRKVQLKFPSVRLCLRAGPVSVWLSPIPRQLPTLLPVFPEKTSFTTPLP